MDYQSSMDATALTETHQKLAALVGDWIGEVSVPPNPELPEGARAQSRISSRFQLNQQFVVADYEQTGLSPTPYTAHGIYGWNPEKGKFTFYWFDSDGWDPGAPALGDWEGDTLQLEENTSMGPTRFTYRFTSKDSYTLKVENSADAKEWKLLFEESFQRAVE